MTTEGLVPFRTQTRIDAKIRPIFYASTATAEPFENPQYAHRVLLIALEPNPFNKKVATEADAVGQTWWGRRGGPGRAEQKRVVV